MVAVLALQSWPVLRTRRRRRAVTTNSLHLAFPPRALRELDAQLRAAAADEMARLERELIRYVTGRPVGYVVAITESAGGLALELSDGGRLTLGGVAHPSRQRLTIRAAADLLRPAVVERDYFSYRLLLRGHRGDELELYARRMALVGPLS